MLHAHMYMRVHTHVSVQCHELARGRTWLTKHRQVALIPRNGGEKLLPHGYGGQLPSLVQLTEECLQAVHVTKEAFDG